MVFTYNVIKREVNSCFMITDIQKYSIHDGEGIRTTIFFKGCPLKCAWCHNPETQSFEQEHFFYEERCVGCGECGGRYYEDCVNNARELCGKELSVSHLLKEILKDQAFYETSNGGVTLSGGEVLCQDKDFILDLVKVINARGISINIDTCGNVDFSRMEEILPYVNVFLYDLKVMDEDEHKKYTGVSNRLILENLVKLSEKGAKIWIRMPIIGGVNDSLENINKTVEYLKDNKIHPEHIHLLPYHNTGSGKYSRLGRKYEDCFYVPEKSLLEEYKRIFESSGFSNVYIGG